jgi:hypothetical protein
MPIQPGQNTVQGFPEEDFRDVAKGRNHFPGWISYSRDL